MAYQIDKVLSIPHSPFRQKGVQEQILKLTEQLVHNSLFYVEYRELKPEKGRRRFLVTRAFNQRDK